LGFDLRNTSSVGPHEIIYGVDHRDDNVKSEYVEDPAVWAEWAWDPEIGRFEEAGKVWGAYLQNHLRLADPLTVSLGVRYDDYALEQMTYGDETSSDGFSGNLGLQYEPVRDL